MLYTFVFILGIPIGLLLGFMQGEDYGYRKGYNEGYESCKNKAYRVFNKDDIKKWYQW